MRFLAHFSGSTGNLYEVISSSGARLLIDPGVTWKKVQKALNYDLSNIVGALCSHNHFDHSKAVEDVLTAGIDVYACADTFEALSVVSRRAKVIEDCKRFKVGDTFEVFPFALWADREKSDYAHDVPIFGFVIFDMPQDECMLFVTDASLIVPCFALAFNIIAICCSYDGVVLRKLEADGKIDPSLAKRLLTSHMEKETTKSYIRDHCCTDKLMEIWLLHMSGTTIDQEKTRAEIEQLFFTKTLIAGKAEKR